MNKIDKKNLFHVCRESEIKNRYQQQRNFSYFQLTLKERPPNFDGHSFSERADGRFSIVT